MVHVNEHENAFEKEWKVKICRNYYLPNEQFQEPATNNVASFQDSLSIVRIRLQEDHFY